MALGNAANMFLLTRVSKIYRCLSSILVFLATMPPHLREEDIALQETTQRQKAKNSILWG